jgi:hypothetical protein
VRAEIGGGAACGDSFVGHVRSVKRGRAVDAATIRRGATGVMPAASPG